MNDIYDPNASQAGQAGIAPYAQPMPGTGAGYDSLFQILWRGRWLILLATVLAGAGAGIYLWRAAPDPKYESTSRILVEKPSSQVRPDFPLQQPVGSTVTNYLATQASLITSPQIIAAALRDPNVVALPMFSDPNYVARLMRTLSATVAKNIDIIQIKASSPYPDDAAQIINAIVRAYVRWHDANRQFTTADLLKDLNSQLENRYRELQLKRKEQMLFEQRHPEVVDSIRGGIVSKTLDLLKQELASVRLTAVERDSYYQGLQRFEKEPEKLRQYISGHQASTTVSTEDAERVRLKEELRSIQLQLQAIAAQTGAVQRSQITLLQNRQTEIEKQIAGLEGQFVQDHVVLAKALAEDTRAREKQLTDLYEKEFSKVQNLSEQDAQYAFLKSECEMIENMCNSLLRQISQLDVGSSLQGLKIYVLEKAVAAKSPLSGGAVKIIGIGLVLGLLVGAGLSFIRDWRDQRVRSPDEIAGILGVPILGAIPSVPRRAIARGQRLRFASNSRESEACLAIRTSLLCGAHRDQIRTILVTSPGPREGKTLLVSNLGMAMAQVGQKTLIVDADLRKPVKQRVFTMNGHGKGLVDVLAGTIGLREAIRPTDIDRLDVLEGGRSTSNPSELLNGPAFAAVLEQLKSQYDRILIDSPPVGLVTDAQILATLCDSTVLVLRAEESSRILTQRARDALLAVGARVEGVVVNDVSRRNSRYGQYSGYGYYHSGNGSNGHKMTRTVLPTLPDTTPEKVMPDHEKKEAIHEPVYERLAVDGGPGAESGSLTPVAKMQDSEATHGEPSGDGNPHSRSEVLPLEIREYDSKATRKEPLADSGTPPANGVLTSEKKKNGRKATSNGQLPAGDPPHENGALGPEKKKNGRKAASNGLSTHGHPRSEIEASAPPRGENGRKAAGEEPPTNTGSRSENGDQAQRWKQWLGGSR